jgi:hypothetical protein
MGVGFKVKYYWYQIGTGDFLHSFFSTISYHLEPNGWGSKYPYLLKELYNGKLSYDKIPNALEEMNEIYSKLLEYKPSQVIWDIEDLTKQPPWGGNISKEITNLANYFVTSDGEDLFKILKNALQKALNLKVNIEIETM